MTENLPRNKSRHIDRLSRDFFSGGCFTWTKSKEEIWSEMEIRLPERHPVRTFRLNGFMLAAAAGFLILIGLGAFFRFYSVTVEAPAGVHKSALLPDGSQVELNAVSTIRYYPYRWWISSRKVFLNGEAHFEVTHGKKFMVISERGRTEVLGTSFNIYARNQVYRVTCLSGRVKVISITHRKTVLNPNDQAEILKNGEIVTSSRTDVYPSVSWRNNIFIFTSVPAGEVFSEIERQYNISILTQLDDQVRYTGNFTKEQNVEEILGYICPALGMKYIVKSKGVYAIIQLDE